MIMKALRHYLSLYRLYRVCMSPWHAARELMKQPPF